MSGGHKMIGIHHCPICGCGTHWETLGEEQSHRSGTLMGPREEGGKMGVHARLLDGFDAGAAALARCRIAGEEVEVRLFDNRG